MSKKMKAKLESLSDKFDYIKEKEKTQNLILGWKDENNINPLDVVIKFIMDKGLKLYGGLALHEHLKKHKNPIYGSSEFPDYDVFSPNAWDHAKELCNILYNMGFYFVEARSSILNDNKHQTYKVSVDTIYILDLTQSGCEPSKMKYKLCQECGGTLNNKCVSIFNHIPVNDLKSYSLKDNKIYRKTYNYDSDSGLYPKKLFICDPNWLKISMYRELTEPYSNPPRLPKVGMRLEKFNKFFEYESTKCSKEEYNKEVKEYFEKILEYIGIFVKKHKLINYGASAYNFFLKDNKYNFGSLNISDYEVYTDEDADVYYNGLLDELNRNFKDYTFKLQTKNTYWKEIDVYNYTIVGKYKNRRYNNLITFTPAIECIPYIQYNGIRYATIDRLKYILFRAVAIPTIVQLTEANPRNYECLLSNLLKIEKDANKKKPKGKFRRFVGKCIGDELPKITQNLFDRFGSKIRATKKTTNYLNFPKDNYITKSYPMPDDGEKFPYKPAELEVKKYKKIKLIKYKQSKKKSTKRSKKQKYKELNKLRNNEIL